MKTVKTIVAYIETPPEGTVMPFRWDVPAKEESQPYYLRDDNGDSYYSGTRIILVSDKDHPLYQKMYQEGVEAAKEYEKKLWAEFEEEKEDSTPKMSLADAINKIFDEKERRK